jgi:serine phosphatase RsbU (regulator of sigma subunit)
LSAGFPLGVVEETDYKEVKQPIEKGEKLFLFTDGLYEARNSKGEELGMENTKKIILQNVSLGIKEIQRLVRSAVLKFSDRNKQHDDITFIVAGKES